MLTPAPLNEARIAAFVRGDVSADERAAIEAAIDRDPRWLAVVAMMVRLDEGTASSAARGFEVSDEAIASEVDRDQAHRVAVGTRLGRYAIEAVVGRGGMGVVYAAEDPQLGRRVALKLLHGGTVDQARMVREARALARVADPRVLAILDVGTWRGRVFVVTELLEGVTLQAWRLAATPHWRRVVEVFLEAGRGLAAAHGRGVVHRDFKPANVMLVGDARVDPSGARGGEHERVVVLDFGLARIEDERDVSREREVVDAATSAEPALDRTVTGRVLGTPAYMAPEQRDGLACGPAADQFAFAVALHAALFGRFPPQASHPSARVGHGAARGRVPAALRRVLARALADHPSSRHPSMSAFVAAIEGATRVPRRVGVAALALPLAIYAAPPGTAPHDRCSGEAPTLVGTREGAAVDGIAAALAGSDRPWSRAAAQGVQRELEAYAAAWSVAHAEACDAADPENAALFDAQMACLDRRRAAVSGLLDALVDGAQDPSTHALAAVAALPSVAGCRGDEALRGVLWLPEEPVARAQIEALRARIDRVGVLRHLARFTEAEALAQMSIAEALALASPGVEAEARIAAAAVLDDLGQYDAVDTELDAAAHAALAAGHDEAATAAWIRRAALLGTRRGHAAEADELLARAEVWMQRLGRPSVLAVERLRTVGELALAAGDPAGARAALERALEMSTELAEIDPIDDDELALLHHGLAAAAQSLGALDDAEAHAREALARLEARVGPDHPNVARARASLATVLRMRGDAVEARALLRSSLAIAVAAHGDRQPVVGEVLLNLAVAELDLGEHADALEHLRLAEEFIVRDLGPSDPVLAKLFSLRGDALLGASRPSDAVAALERARSILVELHGGPHPELAIVDTNLGIAYADLGELDRAAASHLRAIDGLERTVGPAHPDLAVVLVALGQVRRAQGLREDAVSLHRRAIELAPPPFAPYASARLGELLVEGGRTQEGVRRLEAALPALAEFDVDPRLVADLELALAEARRRLAEHPAP
jgi:serine/threonine-protein kinase